MTVTTLIDGLMTFIATYSSLKSGAPLMVDNVGKEPTEYGITPLPGSRVLETYINGTKVHEYPFAFEITESTADDAKRMDNNAFAEAFAEWLDTQSEAGTLPTLATKKTATKIEAVNWGYLFEQGESNTAVYQIQCKLTYEQQP